MKSTARYEHYEKMYQAEQDRREKLYARLNIPLGVIVAVFGFLSYLIKLSTSSMHCSVQYTFYLFIIGGICSLLWSCYHFKQSWSGSSDMFMPTANKTDEHFKLLESTYQSFENNEALVSQYFSEYLLENYIKCASFNAEVNDYRSNQLYKTIRAMSIAVAFSFIAIIVYQVTLLI